ncbi:MAG TPA: MFS transporter [Thermoleophilaceae bacterium]|nr:MFS transporter [Thermoleophilaceae bacterium]
MREEPQAPRFFGAYAQSSLGTGAGYVAVVLVGYQRFHSPLAISLILLADIAPPMVFGPLFGALVDRWSRRLAAVTADCARALAFGGMVLTHSFALTFIFALVAGVGTSLWKPAAMASLPSVVSRERLPAATALYGALTEIGYTVGPGIAGLVLLFTGSNVLLAANAGSFALSALLLSTLSFGSRPARADRATRGRILAEARAGIRVAAQTPAVKMVIVSASSILFFAGLVNVAELLIARQLGAGSTGYALLVTLSGVAITAGSVMGKSGGDAATLRRRFITGLGLFGVGLAGASASPAFAGVAIGISLGGVGNGMVIVFQRLIIQSTVSDELLGRVFGAQVALDGFAFTSSYLVAAALLTAVGPRVLFVIAGAGACAVALATLWALRTASVGGAAARPLAATVAEAESPLAGLGSPEAR